MQEGLTKGPLVYAPPLRSSHIEVGLTRQNWGLTRMSADCADTWPVLISASTPNDTAVAFDARRLRLAPVVSKERGRPGARSQAY